MIPDVMRAVSGGSFRGTVATLADYRRYCLRRKSYPGIVVETGASTPGIVYSEVHREALARVDK